MSTAGLALDDAAWGSPWRTRALRDKAVLAGGLLVCAVALPAWPGGVASGLLAVALVLGPAGVRPGLLVRCLLGPALFIGIGAATVLVSLTFHDGRLAVAVTPETTGQALEVLVRGLAGTCAMFVLATTTPMIDVLTGLRRLGVPAACVDVASLVYRLLFVLLASAGTIQQAQAARLGYATRRAALRSAAAAVTAVLLRSWERARRLEEGLAGRGYVDDLPTLDPPRRASGVFLGATLAGLAALVALSLTLPALLAAGGGR